MRFWLRWLVILGVLGAAGWAAWQPVARYLHERNRPEIVKEKVSRGTITEVVNATGTVKPVLSIEVGAVVSGPIIKLDGEFNQRVEKGQLLAQIDPRIYNAAVARDEANLETANAEKKRVTALLQQSKNNEKRALALQAEDKKFVSQQELDQLRFNRESLEAQLAVAEAAIKQATANLGNSQTNRDFTSIKAPRSGIIIDQKIFEGQSLASQFQTPVLFVVAPELDVRVHVHALVDEADIGLIIEAEKSDQPVHFTVDAYPDRVFEGRIHQVRYSSSTTQNVTTYPVVVEAPNKELLLLPGMTADLSFQIKKSTDVLRVPNAALRFYPDRKYVRPADHAILDAKDQAANAGEDDLAINATGSATERAEATQRQSRRHVWVQEGELLRAVEVQVGVTESRYTELVKGDLKDGDEVVVDVRKQARRT
ncbi:MAG: efflux RND transporter periplasmic adaptor subunit [Pirellulales bacterium]